MMKKLFVAVLFWNFYLQADVLFTETFDDKELGHLDGLLTSI